MHPYSTRHCHLFSSFRFSREGIRIRVGCQDSKIKSLVDEESRCHEVQRSPNLKEARFHRFDSPTTTSFLVERHSFLFSFPCNASLAGLILAMDLLQSPLNEHFTLFYEATIEIDRVQEAPTQTSLLVIVKMRYRQRPIFCHQSS